MGLKYAVTFFYKLSVPPDSRNSIQIIRPTTATMVINCLKRSSIGRKELISHTTRPTIRIAIIIEIRADMIDILGFDHK